MNLAAIVAILAIVTVLGFIATSTSISQASTVSPGPPPPCVAPAHTLIMTHGNPPPGPVACLPGPAPTRVPP